MFDFLKKRSPNYLGIDIGTTGIRLVELAKNGSRQSLVNYGHLESEDYLSLGGSVGNKKLVDNTYLSHDRIVKDLREVIAAMAIDAKKVSMSIPISSAFSSVISLPSIGEDEIDKAVNFEARKYIPIPLEEVNFGWSLVSSGGGVAGDKNAKRGVKVLLVAIPKDITIKYSNITQSLNLELISLETESFPLARSLADGEKGVFTICDIGSKTTSITIVEDGVVLASHSVSNIGGLEITNILSHGFNIDPKRAEALKRDIGLKFSGADKKVSEIMMPIVSVISSDIKKINETYTRDYKKEIDKIILTGGSASLPGIVEFLKNDLKVGVEIGDPWKNISFDEKLKPKLAEIAPQFSIAVGLALRGFEK
ncbi:MAG: type IV pilus assembly protein PilM [Candidatus Paceibacterota bacterium]|jgi:type IV pilus assembly protein PilM